MSYLAMMEDEYSSNNLIGAILLNHYTEISETFTIETQGFQAAEDGKLELMAKSPVKFPLWFVRKDVTGIKFKIPFMNATLACVTEFDEAKRVRAWSKELEVSWDDGVILTMELPDLFSVEIL